MGGVWCRTDRGHTPTYDSKGPFTSTISRWTDHVRQVYRKPKTRHRPPKPPQKPIRIHDRLTISPPQLVTEQSSDGWRTATLIVPQVAPIPPPRKKRKHLQELARTAYSMDDLNSSPLELNKSTFSLQENYSFESGIDSKGSSSTIDVTPVLESRVNHHKPVILEVEEDKTIKEDVQLDVEKNAERESEDIDEVDFGDEIIPVEKETMFTYRTLLHSNLGYIDKLSAISEVSAESGFDDRTDAGKYSERSESVASDDILTRDVGLNILGHINSINNGDHGETTDIGVREKTAKSKKEWLENILKEETAPYLISTEKEEKDSENELLGRAVVDRTSKLLSSPSGHLHLMNTDMKTFETDNSVSKASLSTHESPVDHSVLLGLLRTTEDSAPEAISHPYSYEGESIFLTNTKTNIIYKSLSSDNLTDEYDNELPRLENKNVLTSKFDTIEDIVIPNSKCESTETSSLTNPLSDLNSNIQSEPLTQTSRPVNFDSVTNTLPDCSTFNLVSSFDLDEIRKSKQVIPSLSDLQPSNIVNNTPNCPNIVVNVIHSESEHVNNSGKNENDEKLSVKELNRKGSAASSRRSSLTDSLHEFEISIYDMLKESNKYQESSDEEESTKTVKAISRH